MIKQLYDINQNNNEQIYDECGVLNGDNSCLNNLDISYNPVIPNSGDITIDSGENNVMNKITESILTGINGIPSPVISDEPINDECSDDCDNQTEDNQLLDDNDLNNNQKQEDELPIWAIILIVIGIIALIAVIIFIVFVLSHKIKNQKTGFFINTMNKMQKIQKK